MIPRLSRVTRLERNPEPGTPLANAACNSPAWPLQVLSCSSWDDLEIFREPWIRLLTTVEGTSIFSTSEWLGAWWHCYGDGRNLEALLFFSGNGEMVGLAPLYFDIRVVVGRKLRIVRLVGDGSGDSDNLDFVVRPGFEDACAENFLSWLQQRDDW